jgi:uncharacterized cofD-like protein
MLMPFTPSLGLLSELHRTASWQPDGSRTPIEHLVEFLLTGLLATNAPPGIERLAEQALHFDLRGTRVVILGGGTGLSTILGGNSQMPDWPDQPYVGVKQEFPHLNVVVCTTDDGGSTGRLLKSLPLIGIGDLRKLLLSSILPVNLQRRYRICGQESDDLVRMLHALFNHRFPERDSGFERLSNPLIAISPDLRDACPKQLAESLSELGRYVSLGSPGPAIVPAGHSMGNLLLASAIFMEAHGRTGRPPGLREIQGGIDRIAALIGAPTGRIHAATAAPGQLKFRYANGVEVYGQSKSARVRRDSPVERVTAEFARKPVVSAGVLNAIQEAELIIYAPGSLYTSILPILQLEPIVAAIRANGKALKVLGANSWIQEGETDISLKNQGRGFLVSELIEAYDRNVRDGVHGLFDVVLSANLERIPGNILRNYALEGKSPIHMDRVRVESMGFRPVEATLFSSEQERKAHVIHHDAQRFTLAIRTLLYVDKRLKQRREYSLRHIAAPKQPSAGRIGRGKTRSVMNSKTGATLCDYLASIKSALEDKDYRPAGLKDILVEVAWENRDIHPSHLGFFRGAVVVPAKDWNRNTEWDNVLGYYDPQDQYLKLHKDLLNIPSKIREDLLVALGESLLGQYIDQRNWIEHRGARSYEIVLKPEAERQCFLSDSQLHTYLSLTRMTKARDEALRYRLIVNNEEGFLPPGLLFGLIYAWYLCGGGLTMDYEMSLLRWPLKSLIPLHAKDRARKEALVTFFRTQIFGHSK